MSFRVCFMMISLFIQFIRGNQQVQRTQGVIRKIHPGLNALTSKTAFQRLEYRFENDN